MSICHRGTKSNWMHLNINLDRGWCGPDDRRGFVQQRHRGNAKLPVLGITSRILHTNGAVSILVYILVGVYRESNYQNHSCIEMKTLDVTVPCWFCVYFILMHWNKLTTFPPQTLTANNINIIEPLRVMLLNPANCNICSCGW